MSMDELENGRVYRIRSRNLMVGVWRAETKGFIGIRRKFGSEYLFEEYHYDNGPPFGTARVEMALDVVVPEGMELSESNKALFAFLHPLHEEAVTAWEQFHQEAVTAWEQEEERKAWERASLAYKPKTEAEVETERRREAAADFLRSSLRSGKTFREVHDEYTRIFRGRDD